MAMFTCARDGTQYPEEPERPDGSIVCPMCGSDQREEAPAADVPADSNEAATPEGTDS